MVLWIVDTLSRARAAARRGSEQSGSVPAAGGSGELQKTENRGNEAKKWLKTKDITFLICANDAHFARNFAQNWQQKQQKPRSFRKVNRNSRVTTQGSQ